MVAYPGRIQGFTTNISDIDTTPQEPLGCIRMDSNGTHKYVLFTGTEAVAAGDFVCYVVTDTALQTVDATNSALPAGVADAAHAISVASYGWIKIRGMATLSTALGGSPSVGNTLTNAGASDHALAKVGAGLAETSPVAAICVHVSAPIIVQLMCGN